MVKVPNGMVSYECDDQKGLHLKSGSVIKNLLFNSQHNESAPFLFSGFKDDENPEKPNYIEFSKAIHQTPLVDYLHLGFSIKDTETLMNLQNQIRDFETNENNGRPDIAFYCGYDGHWHLLVQLNHRLNKDYYDAIMERFIDTMNLSLYKPLKTITMSTPIPPIDMSASGDHLIFSWDNNALGLSEGYLKSLKVANEPAVPNPKGYNYDVLKAALTAYSSEESNHEAFSDENYRQDFWVSVLSAVNDMPWGPKFIDSVINQMADTRDKEVKYHDEVEEAKHLIELNPQRGKIAKSLADYLPIYKGANKPTDLPVHNLSDQLKNALGNDFVSDTKLAIDKAADEILKVYPPYLINQSGKNRDNVVIFNPLTGIWTHEDDMFHILLSTVKPYHTKQDYDRMMQAFADNAAMGNRYIKPYSGSRYLLFDNGCLDVTTLSFYQTDSTFVRKLHFTDRSHLHMNYVKNPKLPVIENGKIDNGGDWNPNDFISAYANNDPEKLRLLLFGLSLGLFGGHNFGVHFDIEGQSRWGKSTLSEIYKNLFTSDQVNEIAYSALNARFPFNNYNPSTSVIWISECNTGMKPLDDERGTSIYDKLADSQVRMELKGQKDLVVENPPQVYIDGTQLIQANNLATGPAGRTLAFELPPMTDELKHQCYGTDINNFLSREDVMQWLVWKMIDAYRRTVPDYKQASFQMNLTVTENLDILPDIAAVWREDLITDNSDLSDWFDNDFEPYLTYTTNKHDTHATLMHPGIAYNILYERYYTRYHPHDKAFIKIKSHEKFEREFNQILEQHGWRCEPIGTTTAREKTKRKKISDYQSINFDWDRYFSDNGKPMILSDPTSLPEPFKRKRANWVRLYKIPNANN